MKCQWVLLGAVLGVATAWAEPPKAVDLDFSVGADGKFVNRVAPESRPQIVRSTSPYGRLRGISAIPEAGKRYPGPALDRKGTFGALRFGNAAEIMEAIDFVPKTNEPFAVSFWFYVYAPEQYFGGSLFDIGFGYKEGLRLQYVRANYAPEGWMTMAYGDGSTSGTIIRKNCVAEVWHQLILSSSGKNFTLYIDGEAVQTVDAPLLFQKDIRPNFGGFLRPQKSTLDFKSDAFTIFRGALTAAEVKAAYDAGKNTASIELEKQLDEMALELPKATFGYFVAGKPIPVTLKNPGPATELTVNGKSYPLPLKSPVELKFDRPGVYTVALAARSGGKTLKAANYVAGIVPALPTATNLGAAETATRQPEAPALGLKLDRITVDWREIEPKKQEYVWERFDSAVKRSLELGATPVICLTGIPDWAKRAPGAGNLPEEMELYTKIWRLLVSRHDAVKYFEVWSGLTPGMNLKGSGDAQLSEYAALVKTASTAIREENPEAKVLAGWGVYGNTNFVREFLAKHADAGFDIVSLSHQTGNPLQQRSEVAALVKLAGVKPVWITSCGFAQPERYGELADPKAPLPKEGWPLTMIDEETGAAWQICQLAMCFGDGVEKMILESGPSKYLPELNATDGAPGAKGIALAVFGDQVGTGKIIRLASGDPALHAFRYQNPAGKSGLLLFAPSETTVKVSATTPEVTVLDLYGNTTKQPSAAVKIGPRPIYVPGVAELAK